MEILRFCPEEQLQIKYYVTKRLILLKFKNMMKIKEVLLQQFTKGLVLKLNTNT